MNWLSHKHLGPIYIVYDCPLKIQLVENKGNYTIQIRDHGVTYIYQEDQSKEVRMKTKFNFEKVHLANEELTKLLPRYHSWIIYYLYEFVHVQNSSDKFRI